MLFAYCRPLIAQATKLKLLSLQNVVVQHQLAGLLLELLDLLVFERLVVLGPGPQRILCPEEESLLSLFDLGHLHPVLARRFLRRGLALDDAHDQRHPPFRRSELRVLLRLLSHRSSPSSRDSITAYGWLQPRGEQDT